MRRKKKQVLIKYYFIVLSQKLLRFMKKLKVRKRWRGSGGEEGGVATVL
jgi:hypothetical protein